MWNFVGSLCVIGAVSFLPLFYAENDTVHGLILGGEQAKPHEFPWLVNFQINKNEAFCGGILINEQVVLTAAHCLVKVKSDKITVVAGDHRLKSNDGIKQRSKVANIVIHEDYDDDENTEDINDLALVFLKTKFKLGREIQIIGIPQQNKNPSGLGWVAGWGHMDKIGNKYPAILRKVSVPVKSKQMCKKLVENENLQFCAGEEGKTFCKGDSGGGFITTRDPNVVSGIVSYFKGEQCGEYEGVYVKVSAYSRWIETQMNEANIYLTSGGGDYKMSIFSLLISYFTLFYVL